jgi:hypothetical protein
VTTDTRRLCACPDTDARTCYDLRYYGRSPVMRGSSALIDGIRSDDPPAIEDDDECQCICHDPDDEDDQW